MESNNVKELTKKQELNNHIVCMRKRVRQAKVHVIRKLTREVKKLRDRKGSEEVQLKSKRKADRLYLEITTIKHLKEDKVSISALYNTLKLDEVLQNIKSTIEDRAVARLVHHPSVNTQVQNYRNANPNWKLQIPVLLEKNPAKLKKAQKKEAEKEKLKLQKQQQLLNKNNTVKATDTANKLLENKIKAEDDNDDDDEVVNNAESSDEENKINSDVEDNSEPSDQESGDEDIDNDTDSIVEEEVEKEEDESDDEEEEEEEEEDKEEEEQEEIKKPIVTKSNKKLEKIKPNTKPNSKKNNNNNNNNQNKEEVTPKKEPIVLNKTQGTIKVQVIKDWSELEEETTNNNKPEISTSTYNNNLKKPKSSFFLGGVDDKINKEDKEKQVQQHYNDNLNRRARRGNVPVKPQRGPKQDFNKSEHSNRNSSTWGVQNKGGGDRFNKFGSSSNKNDFGKQNQRPQRYFDKNPSESSSSFNKQGPGRKPNLLQPDYLKKNTEGPKTGTTEKLHPSWEAKKRQSAILPSFQGKKIKFDD